jgi:hypothetical protein
VDLHLLLPFSEQPTLGTLHPSRSRPTATGAPPWGPPLHLHGLAGQTQAQMQGSGVEAWQQQPDPSIAKDIDLLLPFLWPPPATLGPRSASRPPPLTPAQQVRPLAREHAHAYGPHAATAITWPGHGVDHQKGGAVTLALPWPLAPPETPSVLPLRPPRTLARLRPSVGPARPPGGGALRMTQKGETRRSSGTPRVPICSPWKFFPNIFFN